MYTVVAHIQQSRPLSKKSSAGNSVQIWYARKDYSKALGLHSSFLWWAEESVADGSSHTQHAVQTRTNTTERMTSTRHTRVYGSTYPAFQVFFMVRMTGWSLIACFSIASRLRASCGAHVNAHTHYMTLRHNRSSAGTREQGVLTIAWGESVQKNWGLVAPRNARSLHCMAVLTHRYDDAMHPTRKDTVCISPLSISQQSAKEIIEQLGKVSFEALVNLMFHLVSLVASFIPHGLRGTTLLQRCSTAPLERESTAVRYTPQGRVPAH